MAHCLNANLVHKWRQLASAPVSAPAFIALPLAPSPTLPALAGDLVVEPLDMRCGTDTALTRVVQVFGSAKSHHAYLRQPTCHPDEDARA